MKHSFIITEAPSKTPSIMLPDGAVAGNGDLSLIWSGAPDCLRFYISKVDFWKAVPGDRSDGGLSPVCVAELRIPQLSYSPYRVEEDLDGAFIEGSFEAAHVSAKVKTTVCATENVILVELDVTRPGSSVSLELRDIEGNGAVCENQKLGGTQLLSRAFDSPELYFPSKAYAALREISREKKDGRELIRWAIEVATNHDTAAARSDVIEKLECIDGERFERLLGLHAEWWSDFWSKSGVSLGEEYGDLENHWYAGLYIMACCARNRRFAPGLWGNFSTADKMAWHSDFHLNYNYQAPFYALAASNHTELMDCYDAPVEDFVPVGRRYAREYLGCRGVYYPVGIGPLGLDTSLIDGTKEHGKLFLGQKSNASYAAVIMAMRWYATRDESYAHSHAYPYMREVADFWEDYLVYENGRYIDYNDANNEVEYYSDYNFMPKRHDEVNPMLSLGMIKMTMRCLIDMSETLGIDADRRDRWRDIYEHVGPVITCERDGKTFLRATEEGSEKTAIQLQYAYPAGEPYGDKSESFEIGLKNLFESVNAWVSDNLFCSYYPLAARLGVEPGVIIGHLRENIEGHSLPNGMFKFGGGGIENSAAIPATLDEMLLGSFDGTLRLFPNWDMSRSASFRNLRANGAFLVSAELENGAVHAELFSEKGYPLLLAKPKTPDGAKGEYLVVKNGVRIPFGGDSLPLETSAGEKFEVIFERTGK